MDRHGTNEDPRPDPPPGAARGQVVILFALFSTALLGVLGLATDLGFAFAQRRTVQNAADAGALAGARIVARWSAANSGLAALPDVADIVAANRMGEVVPGVTSCHYVDDADQWLASCSAPVHPRATGVAVSVREEHPTFFLRVVPGAPQLVSTAASATAHVQRLTRVIPAGPFLVCGKQTRLASGGTRSILTDRNTINPDAVGQTFRLHGPALVADCGLASALFKGIADEPRNAGRSVGEWWLGTEGTVAGPVQRTVSGVEGCQNNAAAPYGCVMILPVFTDDPAPRHTPGSPEVWVVLFAAFRVTGLGSNGHVGVLLDDYVDPASINQLGAWTGSNGWTRDAGGLIVIRLTQ